MVEQNLVGKKLGDYIMREKLTSGGMAHIYLGEDEKLQRRAAIKILTSDMAGDDEILRERFEREARAVAKLEHDNIVPIYQFGEEGNLYFIAMRYIEGNDLADEIKSYKEREEKMPIDRLLKIMEQIASALDHAHKRGIIHRDVKPSNILLRRPEGSEQGDKAVLTDFGLVLWEDVDKTLGTAFGTPRYISPEQATDSQSAVPQSDVYSLAVIVYEILTGHVLFTGNTPMEVALSHITEPPKPPRAHDPSIPVDAQREVLKALQKDSKKRHSTAMRFVQALKEAYNLHETGTKPPTHPKSYATKPFRDEIDLPSAIDDWETEKKSNRTIVIEQTDSTNKIPLPTALPMNEDGQGFVEPDVSNNTGLRSVIIIGGGIAVVLFALAYVSGIFNEGANNNDINTQPANANMEILYNEDFFAIANISENATLNIQNLVVEGASGAVGQNFGNELAPGECHFVKRSAVSDGTIPDEWNCDGVAIRNESNNDIFWRAEDANDATFSVENSGTSVATCNTAGRAVGRAGNNSCPVAWPQYTTNE